MNDGTKQTVQSAHSRQNSDHIDWTKRWSKRTLLSIFLFVVGAVLVGISIGTVIEYNEWKNATTGQCQYVEAVAVECRGTRNCRGWKVGHVYAVDNTTEAYAKCVTVSSIDEQDSCICDTVPSVQYELPDNADNAWHECHVTACDSVSFESIHTKSEYTQSLVMFVSSVIAILAACGLCIFGKKRRKLSDDDSIEHGVDMFKYQQQETTVATKSVSSNVSKSNVTLKSSMSVCLEMSTVPAAASKDNTASAKV